MNCPKCGNKYIMIAKDEVYCVNFNCELSFHYQQKLKNVLSKFEKDDGELFYDLTYNTFLYFEDGTMWFKDSDDIGAGLELSLDTVKSILKDLGDDE